jgi:hypothetical protein
MSYRVVFTPEAEEQLVTLYGYIADAASFYHWPVLWWARLRDNFA